MISDPNNFIPQENDLLTSDDKFQKLRLQFEKRQDTWQKYLADYYPLYLPCARADKNNKYDLSRLRRDTLESDSDISWKAYQ